MKFKIPYLTRLLEIKELQLEIEEEKSKELFMQTEHLKDISNMLWIKLTKQQKKEILKTQRRI